MGKLRGPERALVAVIVIVVLTAIISVFASYMEKRALGRRAPVLEGCPGPGAARHPEKGVRRRQGRVLARVYLRLITEIMYLELLWTRQLGAGQRIAGARRQRPATLQCDYPVNRQGYKAYCPAHYRLSLSDAG
ncbi:MAG TPA: hypothetical protein VI756_10440 [Blastocatellia bacterium]